MTNQTALKILNDIQYATIATSDEKGEPWNTPVYCAFGEDNNIYWSSHPESQHSRNIAVNSKVFIVIYNSIAPEGDGVGVYLRATSEALVDPAEIDRALVLLGDRRGRPFLFPKKFQNEGPQRIYKATPVEAWINDADQDSDGDFIKDFRVPIEL